MDPASGPNEEQWKEVMQMMKQEHYGIKSKQILPGNIGYLNITVFGLLDLVADSLTAAMNYLSGTDALIIDLRECHGSMDPGTIPFLSGYFFKQSTHLNDIYNRLSNETVQYWSYGWVPGTRYLNKPVYILTGGGTFSGGEEFAYDFKNLKRATLVGEPTRGGANPGEEIRANDHFQVFVPTGRAINPISKTNWEGTGVQPDSVVKANLALHKANELAVLRLMKAATATEKMTHYKDVLDSLHDHAPVFSKWTFTLKGFEKAQHVSVAGNFNAWSPTANPMTKDKNGWAAMVDVEPGKILYKFIVDGNWITDPQNANVESSGGNDNSYIIIKK